jgi:hypothetical protein
MFGVQVHAACVESTHFHLVVTDMEGRLSDFMHWLDRHVARCLIEHYASTHPMHHLDGIWTKSPFSATLLVNREAILGAIVYTLVNPQKDGLVADYRDWPGFHTRPSHWLAQPTKYQKPRLYFSASKQEHAVAELTISAPPAFSDCAAASLVRDVEELIREKQDAVRATMRASKRSFLGVKALMRRDPFDSPRAPRAKAKINPRVAAGGNGGQLAAATRALQNFRARYREAWRALQANAKTVVFPGGTLHWRRLLSVTCEPLDTPWCLRCST